MSDLSNADYTKSLVGKTIKRVRWSNYDDWHSLSIELTDQTLASFQFHFNIEEEVELADFKGGNLSNERTLEPVPVLPKDASPESED